MARRGVLEVVDDAVHRGPLKIVKYLWGFLTSETDTLAAPGQKYPFCEWSSKMSRVSLNEKGEYSFIPTESFKAVLASGVTITPQRYEVWDGSTITETSGPIRTDRPKPT
jgi:hypothetical protein